MNNPVSILPFLGVLYVAVRNRPLNQRFDYQTLHDDQEQHNRAGNRQDRQLEFVGG